MKYWVFSVLSAGLLATASPIVMAAAGDFCENVDDWVQAGPVAFGNVQLHRGALDFEGARIAGCLRNDGDGTLKQVMLEFDAVMERGGGGFSTNLRLAGLEPGQSTVFLTDQHRHDPDSYERFGTTGYRFTSIDVLMDGHPGRPEFSAESGLTLPRLLLDRPEHELEAECAATDPASGEGEVWISNARLESVGMPGSFNVVGCVTNRSDQAIAEGMRHHISASYEGRAGNAPNRMGLVGGQGNLVVSGPLAPGQSSLFLSSFSFDQGILEIEVYPSRYDYTGDSPGMIELGPKVLFEKN
jgi:hypothetical protein